MKEHLNVGLIGCSGRGMGHLGLLVEMEDISITAVCDVYEDRVENAQKCVAEHGGSAKGFTDYTKMLEEPLDAVFICTDWTSHARIACCAMEHGIYAGFEVGGATCLEECWELVRTSERTGVPCMLLENCCYGREELLVQNLVRKGLFGDVVYCAGSYSHCLNFEVALGRENRHYRLRNYMHRNGELYPTHELGPIAKLLNINRGNRMLTMTSMATRSSGIGIWAREHRPGSPECTFPFNEGDVVTTMIKCAHGEVIFLTHDTSLPHPYSRGGRVQGTKGIWLEDNKSVFLEGHSPVNEDYWSPEMWESLYNYSAEYEHPIWKEFMQEGVKGGHGGMDWLVERAFLESCMEERQTPIDVYDSAAWMAITCLSEDSIALGSQPVAIPDFTRGRWLEREPAPVTKYGLDRVYDELF